MAEYKLKTGKMAEKATDTYKKIEDTVVGSYKKIEDAFVDTFLEKVENDNNDAADPVSEAGSEK